MKIKSKGAYAWRCHRHKLTTIDIDWHQNHSALVVPMAAESFLLHGVPIDEFIITHMEPLDFCLHAKAPRSNRIVAVNPDGSETPLQNINRYYVSHEGVELVKIAPPVKGARVGTWKRKNGVGDFEYDLIVAELRVNPTDGEVDVDGLPHDERIHTKAKSKHVERRMGFAKGWKATVCNTMDDFDFSTINHEYYINEARKLVDPLM